MSNDVNRQWVLVRRPEGNIREDDFQLTEGPIPTPKQAYAASRRGMKCDRNTDPRSIHIE